MNTQSVGGLNGPRIILLAAALGLAQLGTAYGQESEPVQARDKTITDPPYRPSRPVAETVVQPGVEGLLDVFKTHRLVGLSISHGSAPGGEFYKALIRDPRFAREVGNVVVEFGGAIHQDVIDRYVAGEAVPYTELRNVWTDVVGWIPIAVTNQSYVDFFAEVRAVNRTLPPDQRIRVWLGEPKIDWSKVGTDEWPSHRREVQITRDSHAASVINRNILAQNRKALVIYGGGHFLRACWAAWLKPNILARSFS